MRNRFRNVNKHKNNTLTFQRVKFVSKIYAKIYAKILKRLKTFVYWVMFVCFEMIHSHR